MGRILKITKQGIDWYAAWEDDPYFVTTGPEWQEAAKKFIAYFELPDLRFWNGTATAILVRIDEPNQAATKTKICPECQGAKRIVMFTTAETCKACEGRGEISA